MDLIWIVRGNELRTILGIFDLRNKRRQFPFDEIQRRASLEQD
jgi:hypothetical protein